MGAKLLSHEFSSGLMTVVRLHRVFGRYSLCGWRRRRRASSSAGDFLAAICFRGLAAKALAILLLGAGGLLCRLPWRTIARSYVGGGGFWRGNSRFDLRSRVLFSGTERGATETTTSERKNAQARRIDCSRLRQWRIILSVALHNFNIIHRALSRVFDAFTRGYSIANFVSRIVYGVMGARAVNCALSRRRR